MKYQHRMPDYRGRIAGPVDIKASFEQEWATDGLQV
jgi:hypothetical protein